MLLFFFVPETFWDRTPRARVRSHRRPHVRRSVSDLVPHAFRGRHPHPKPSTAPQRNASETSPAMARKHKDAHVGFADGGGDGSEKHDLVAHPQPDPAPTDIPSPVGDIVAGPPSPLVEKRDMSRDARTPTPATQSAHPDSLTPIPLAHDVESVSPGALSPARSDSLGPGMPMTAAIQYTNRLREQPRIPYVQSLKPWNGRIAHDRWLRVAVRPFILFAYPAVLWSSTVYALSVGWLIVISESIAYLFERPETYNFTALQTGLVYISPFVGGLLGTAVAGKVSDVVVRYMARRNGGVYEPEFRLVMGIPIALATTIGLMAFGWSAELHDSWIVPTIFFGTVAFGCCLGSTTSITFVVDSYRQYAGEALVTLNFSKSESVVSPVLSIAAVFYAILKEVV